jgi:C4-dicarboxylate-specific signal transduction histidine kinase
VTNGLRRKLIGTLGVLLVAVYAVAPAAQSQPRASAVERWDRDEAQPPSGSQVLSRDPRAWVRYRGWVLATIALMAVQATIIAALLSERRRRRHAALALALAESEAARARTEAQMRLHLHELAHVNVLAAIGHSAAAVAHELNQPLTAVLSNAQALQMMLRRQAAPNAAALEILDDIITADKRAGDIIERMRRLMRKEIFSWTPVDLNLLVRDVAQVISPDAARAGVRVVAELAPGLPAVRGDRVQLLQVLLNLGQNGVHASAQGHSPGPLVQIITARDGDALQVRVTDSGTGVPGEILPQLFEPFFTTKTDGLGLGLSISRTIVEQHGGVIAVNNRPEGGAEFSVRLPAILEPAA